MLVIVTVAPLIFVSLAFSSFCQLYRPCRLFQDGCTFLDFSAILTMTDRLPCEMIPQLSGFIRNQSLFTMYGDVSKMSSLLSG